MCMRILHNSIYNRCKLDTTTAKPTIARKNENRRNRIRNRSPTRPNTNSRRPHTRQCHRTPKKQQPRPNHQPRQRTPSTTTTRRNMQRSNPKTLGRKLLQRPPRPRRSPQRTRTQRIPLRPNSSGSCISRLSKRWNLNPNRQTQTLPIRTKKTSCITFT